MVLSHVERTPVRFGPLLTFDILRREHWILLIDARAVTPSSSCSWYSPSASNAPIPVRYPGNTGTKRRLRWRRREDVITVTLETRVNARIPVRFWQLWLTRRIDRLFTSIDDVRTVTRRTERLFTSVDDVKTVTRRTERLLTSVDDVRTVMSSLQCSWPNTSIQATLTLGYSWVYVAFKEPIQISMAAHPPWGYSYNELSVFRRISLRWKTSTRLTIFEWRFCQLWRHRYLGYDQLMSTVVVLEVWP